jgi:peptidoglycan/xylan/chitin deacetylase (PgdA/CDA1 family)
MADFWPNGARIAVTISLMFESGGQMRPESGALGPLGAVPMPLEYPDLPTESYFEYGYREGIPRLLDLFDKHGVKVTSFMVGRAVERSPDMAREIAQRGQECAGHGWEWVPQYAMSEADEREFIRKSVEVIERVTGQKPVGWNCNALRRSVRTLELLREQGFIYHIDDVSRDEPFVTDVGGRPFVTVPYCLHHNDLVCYEFQGFSTTAYLQLMKDEFDCLYAEGERRRRMLVVSCHDRVMGRPARVQAFDALLRYIKGFPGVWIARKDDIARFMLEEAT